jgi:Na+/proline symporter
VVFGAFFAAVLSSADTFVNNASLFVTRIAVPRLWSRKQEQSADRALLNWSRGFAFVLIGVALLVGVVIPNIVDLLVGAFSLLLIYLPTILGLFLPRWRSNRAAFWSPASGAVLFAALFFAWNPKIAFAPAVILSIVTYGLIRATEKAT